VAEQRRADLEYELNNNLYREPARTSWKKVRDLFEAEHLPNLRSGTARVFRITLDQFEEIAKPGALRSINERTLSIFVRGLRERKGLQCETMQPSTIVTKLRFLHGIFAWAVEQGFLDKVPKFPSVKVPRKKPQPVATELFERLVDVVQDQQTRTFLLCGWLAGLRLNEAFELEWEPSERFPWVDLDRNRLWLPAAFVKATEDQWLPLDPQLSEALQALPRHGKKVFRFTNIRGGKHAGERVLASSLSQRIVRLARKAGVRLTVRALRRGFGCRYAGKVPAQVLQKLMRHSNISITMDYYANVDQAVEDAVLGSSRNSSRNNSYISSPQTDDAEAQNPQENGT
jgi:integrase